MNSAKDAGLFVFDEDRKEKCSSSFINYTNIISEDFQRPADHSYTSSVCDSSFTSQEQCSQVSSENRSETSIQDSIQISKKFVRTSYTPEQLQKLSDAFRLNKYPNADELEQMSSVLGVSAKKIKIWFQNKRARSKRRNVEESFEFTKPQLSANPTDPPSVFPYELSPSYAYVSTVPPKLYTPGASPPPTTSVPSMMTESKVKPSLTYDTSVSIHYCTPAFYQGLQTAYPYMYPYRLYSH